MRWRQWNIAIHRDLGYLCFGLTVIYAISGLAVNHLHDGQWNPSYRFERSTANVGALPIGEVGPETVRAVLDRLEEKRPMVSYFQSDPETLEIFFDKGSSTRVRLRTGEVVFEKAVPRPLLSPMNFLHLNHPKRLWTWCADLYAVALATLATTGLFILPGKKGITGRGAWLTALGVALPIAFLVLYR